MPEVSIAPESPRQDDVIRLIKALDAYLYTLYPTESCHLLDVDGLAAPDMRFFVARRGGEALGCVALRIDAEGYGEVKRMYVDPAARGGRIGRRLLERLEVQAQAETLSAIRLETGIHQPEALGLYRSLGYRERGVFGGYAVDPNSIFMEKPLVESMA